jgi:hypothetical protein
MADEAEWARRKSRLNHRVLQNRFLLALRAVETELQASGLAPEHEAELLGETLPGWPALRAQVREIAAEFPAAMSPAALFEEEPLSRLAATEREATESLVVGLWRSRHRVDAVLARVDDALAESDDLYRRVVEEWAEASPEKRLERLRAFSSACLRVSEALSALPAGRRGV